nr:uncharacterized protein LOC112290744 [Physcomitrium patens]|eukprot:XP_024393156.1 uncharacterized protein LOC112290744 [Physcomitrella patens]
MAEQPPDHSMCAKCRKIDFRKAFFVKRSSWEDIFSEIQVHSILCNIAHILNTHNKCRCCCLILHGTRRFHPSLEAQKSTKLAWDPYCNMQAKVEVQEGEVEFRSVVYIYPGYNFDKVLAINLLSRQDENEASKALRTRRVKQHQAELTHNNNWVSTCNSRHKDCHHLWPRSSFEELRFRVIDVQDRCIVPVSKNCEYVALSYMWGTTPMLLTLKSNIEMSSLPQGLDKGPSPLPRTISDAMELVGDIGQRYLWVDALCIIQNDKKDQEHQIRNMDLVYGFASFTIIAADGDGADAGLVGVKDVSRNIVQDIEEVEPDLHLAVSLSGFGTLQRARSKWNTRAWTFQAALLSRRMVIFFGGEMTWECREAVWTEDLHISSGTIGSFIAPHYSNHMTPLLERRLAASKANPSAYASSFAAMNHDNLTMHENAVREYTARQMTYLSDMLNAFAGLAKIFETPLATGFSQGLPKNRLDTALLWTPEQALTRRPGFASWSWAGWVGKSRYFSMNYNIIKPMVCFDNEPQNWEEQNYEPPARPWRVVKPRSPTQRPILPQPTPNHRLCFSAYTASSGYFQFENLEPPLPVPLFVALLDQDVFEIGRMGLDRGAYPASGVYSLIVLSECSEPVQQEGLIGRDVPTENFLKAKPKWTEVVLE